MKNILHRMKSNWKSGVTVSLISIPLSVSLAVASQTSPMVGIVTAIWAGLIASIFGGSNFNIVGPTAALSGIIATYSIAHGAGSLALLSIVSGVFIFIAYILKLEKYLVFIPGSAVHGFTLGVALTIGFGQLNNATGIFGLTAHEHFYQNLFETLSHISSASYAAVIMTLLSVIFLFVFRKLTPKFPGPILLAPIGVLIGYLSVNGMLPFAIRTLGMQYPTLKATLFIMPNLTIPTYLGSLITTSFAIAIIAILETIISAKIADNMTTTRHDSRKEMFGLGFANIVSGLMGGMPATAALARTSLNVKSGADHKSSATINTVSVMVLSFILLKYFIFMPLPIIAAILIYVAYNMIEPHAFKRMFLIDKTGFVISVLVAVVTFYRDPIVGILLGTAISLLIFAEKVSRGYFEATLNYPEQVAATTIHGHTLAEIEKAPDTLAYSIKGQLVFLNSQSHVLRFEHHFHACAKVILRLGHLHMIDADGVEALDEIITFVKKKGSDIYITGVNPLIFDMMQHSKQFNHLVKEEKVFAKAGEVLNILGYRV